MFSRFELQSKILLSLQVLFWKVRSGWKNVVWFMLSFRASSSFECADPDVSKLIQVWQPLIGADSSSFRQTRPIT